MKIKRGATYNIPVYIKIKGENLPLRDVKQVDFSFGGELLKTYPPSADTGVSLEEDKFIVHLSAEDTSRLQAGILHLQARITFNDGNIKFSEPDTLYVTDTKFIDISKVVVNAV